MLFTGFAELTIDAKGRLAIPAKYRSQWVPERDGAAWFCVPWSEGRMLRLYTEGRFTQLSEQAPHSLTPGADEANLDADFYGLVARLEMDSAGRVILPREHLELVGLGTEVVVIGARNRLEVRDRATWKASLPERFTTLPRLVERIESKRNTKE
ncbi:MAG: hypothetical protein SFY96_06305 [Planctomycetota bacterium]|nr:hypothetical protein [Planctomycetota bacterium]